MQITLGWGSSVKITSNYCILLRASRADMEIHVVSWTIYPSG